jgi:hypothetical protein
MIHCRIVVQGRGRDAQPLGAARHGRVVNRLNVDRCRPLVQIGEPCWADCAGREVAAAAPTTMSPNADDLSFADSSRSFYAPITALGRPLRRSRQSRTGLPIVPMTMTWSVSDNVATSVCLFLVAKCCRRPLLLQSDTLFVLGSYTLTSMIMVMPPPPWVSMPSLVM